jgi:hypothetical protein
VRQDTVLHWKRLGLVEWSAVKGRACDFRTAKKELLELIDRLQKLLN